MLHIENNDVRKLLYQGCFGLEKESLRITPEGFLSHTPHPFPDDPHIVRDFCENQTEINTSVHHSAEGVVRELSERTEQIQKTLAELPEAELLWPFSNPPYIRSSARKRISPLPSSRGRKVEIPPIGTTSPTATAAMS